MNIFLPNFRKNLNHPKVVGKIDLDSMNLRTRPAKKSYKESEAERKQSEKDIKQRQADEQPPIEEGEEHVKETRKEEKAKEHVIRAKAEKLAGPTVVGKIDLPSDKEGKKLVASSSDFEADRFKKRKRKRIKIEGQKITVTEDGKTTERSTTWRHK